MLRPVALFIVAITLATACSRGAPGTRIAAPSLPESKHPRELNSGEQIAHALRRLTFGARPTDSAQVAKLGLDRWLKLQLTPELRADHAADSALAPFPFLSMSVRELLDSNPPRDLFIRQRKIERGLPDTTRYVLDADDSVRFNQITRQTAQRNQLISATKLIRATVADHQLLEMMTDFWENHFSIFRGKLPTTFALLEYDRDVIRPRALGKFRDLLGAVAHTDAMLYYLDNNQSTADPQHLTLVAWNNLAVAKTARDSQRIRTNASRRRGGLNENYARELMELHTLGADGGYTQSDVVNVARALTGWHIKPLRDGGGFQFNAASHDAEAKLVLGQPLPAGRGIEDGEQVLDILAAHPSTARYIATKLVRHFVADVPPPALVARVAAEFSRTGGDIRRALALLVSSPEFYARSAVRAKVKTPYQLVASTFRALGTAPDSTGRAVGQLPALGQPLFGRQTPDGWPDDGVSWLNTGAMLTRINFVVRAASGTLPGSGVKASEHVSKVLVEPAFQRR